MATNKQLDDLQKTGLATAAQKSSKKNKAEEKKREEALKRAILVSHKWYGIFKPSGMLLTFEVGLTLISLRLYIADLTGTPAKFKSLVYDPATDHYASPFFFTCLFVCCTHFLLFKILIPALARKTFDAEQNYIQSIPFSTENYFETIGQKDLGQFQININWKNKLPEQILMQDLCDGIKSYPQPHLVATHHKGIGLKFIFRTNSAKNGNRAISLMHHIHENMLAPLHAAYEIQSISFS